MAIGVGDYASSLQQILQLTSATGQIGTQTALYTAQMAFTTAQIEAQGVMSQLQMNQMSAAANVISDLQNLAMRHTMGLATKAQEMSLFIAQYREKTLNLFLQIQDGRDNNTWSRVKRYAQGFKF
ncbi:MAG: hypothetical protein AAF621_07370 [Pseudomonadota bacterium]